MLDRVIKSTVDCLKDMYNCFITVTDGGNSTYMDVMPLPYVPNVSRLIRVDISATNKYQVCNNMYNWFEKEFK